MTTLSALVTGAGSGIGAAIAHEFDRRGYHVFLLGRNEKNLRHVADSLSKADVLVCDLDQPAEIEAAAQRATSRPDLRLQILVNNAGVFHTHTTEEGTDEIWTRQFQTNLLGPVRLTRALWPSFRAQRQGSIVNVSSTLGLKPTATTSAYSALKAALINWTQALALEGGALGVRANVVCPGFVDTPIHAFHHLPLNEKQKVVGDLGRLQPLGRIGTPEEIAKAVAFLASNDSPWTTGATLNVDGGIYLA